MGNRHYIKLIQGCKPTLRSNLPSVAREAEMEVLELRLKLSIGFGQLKELAERIGWKLRMEVELLSLAEDCFSPVFQLTMNVNIWNSRDALKPNFLNHVQELTRSHDGHFCGHGN